MLFLDFARYKKMIYLSCCYFLHMKNHQCSNDQVFVYLPMNKQNVMHSAAKQIFINKKDLLLSEALVRSRILFPNYISK